jgi:hypothetical protein
VSCSLLSKAIKGELWETQGKGQEDMSYNTVDGSGGDNYREDPESSNRTYTGITGENQQEKDIGIHREVRTGEREREDKKDI